jgi:hypothetical protein
MLRGWGDFPLIARSVNTAILLVDKICNDRLRRKHDINSYFLRYRRRLGPHFH